MTTPNPDDYAYWRAALAGERPPVHERDPQCGYYAYRLKSGPALRGSSRWPVAIWRAADPGSEIIALRGYEEGAGYVDAADLWLDVAAHPITEEVYRAAYAAGRFADDLPAEALAPPRVPRANTADGANLPNVATANEELADQIDSAVQANVMITTDADLGSAQSLRARLNELANKADKLREKEKGPHLEAGRAVDAKWQPLVKKAKDRANTIASDMSRYANDRDKKAIAAAAEARRLAEKAQEAGQEPPATTAAPEPPPPPLTRVKGGYGRAASIVVVKTAAVVDHAAFAAALLAGRFGDDWTGTIRDFLAGAAERLARAGVADIPGVEVRDEKKVQ